MACASSGWQAGSNCLGPPRGSRRALEIVGIVFAFFWFWPVAAAYIVWKVMGYPVPANLRADMERRWGDMFADRRFATAPFGTPSSGNLAFDEYRRGEIERLEAERRRLDDEAREFRGFVEELKRAKDREEFDAYMARRRQSGPQTA